MTFKKSEDKVNVLKTSTKDELSANPHYKKCYRHPSNRRKMIPDRNMNLKKGLKINGKDNYMNKYINACLYLSYIYTYKLQLHINNYTTCINI